MSGKVGLETSSVENLSDVVGSSLGLVDGVAAEVVGALVVVVTVVLVAVVGPSGVSSDVHPVSASTASTSTQLRRRDLMASDRTPAGHRAGPIRACSDQ